MLPRLLTVFSALLIVSTRQQELRFSEQPTDVVIPPGVSAKFRCRLDLPPVESRRYRFSWLKDGRSLRRSGKRIRFAADGGTVYIKNAMTEVFVQIIVQSAKITLSHHYFDRISARTNARCTIQAHPWPFSDQGRRSCSWSERGRSQKSRTGF